MIGLLGIVLGLALLIWLMVKGNNMYITCILAVIVISIFNGIDLNTGLMGYWIGGFVGYFKYYFLLFLAGALFGKFMQVSGAAVSIARAIVNIFPRTLLIFAVPIVGAFMTYGGISVFVCAFAIVPIALEIFRAVDIPRPLIPAALCAGACTVGQVSPGAPMAQNLIPMREINALLPEGATQLTPTAGVGIGWISISTLFIATMVWWYLIVKSRQKKGQHFVALSTDVFPTEEEVKLLPNPILSLIPMIVTVVFVNLKINGTLLFSEAYIGVLIGTAACLLLMFNRIKWSEFLTNCGDAATSTIGIVCTISAVSGIGTVVKFCPSFNELLNVMNSWNLNPLFGAVITCNVMCALCGSASGGLGVVVPLMAPTYLAAGVVPAALSRVFSIASIGMDSLPHNGAIVGLMSGVCKETHKSAYMPIFWLTAFITCIWGFITAALFIVFPNLPV